MDADRTQIAAVAAQGALPRRRGRRAHRSQGLGRGGRFGASPARSIPARRWSKPGCTRPAAAPGCRRAPATCCCRPSSPAPGVTLRAVATALSIDIRDARVSAEGDLDVRGTLGVGRDAPVGFRAIRLHFELASDAPPEDLDRLYKLTERYCVVYQTLTGGAPVTISRGDISEAPEPRGSPERGHTRGGRVRRRGHGAEDLIPPRRPLRAGRMGASAGDGAQRHRARRHAGVGPSHGGPPVWPARDRRRCRGPARRPDGELRGGPHDHRRRPGRPAGPAPHRCRGGRRLARPQPGPPVSHREAARRAGAAAT